MAVTADKVVVELELKDGQYLAKVKQAERQFSQSQDRMAGSAKNTERQIKSSSNAISASLRSMAGIIAAGASATAIKGLADSYTQMGNRLRVVGHEAGAASDQFDKLMDVAMDSRSDIETTVQVYSRLSLAAEGMGLSAADVTRTTEILTKSLKASGATAQETSAALLQFGQGVGSGALMGDELRSIRENAPLVARAIANEFDTTIGGLKKLGEDGMLTSDRVLKAVLVSGAQVDALWAKTVPTISDSFAQLRNQLVKYLGEADAAGGYSDRLSKAITSLADNLDRVIPALTVVAGAFALRWAAGMTAAAVASDGFAAKAWSAAQQAIAAERAKTAAVAVETRTRTMLLNAEVMALQRQVATGRNAQGQFINMAAAQTQLASSTRALAGSMPAATAATIRNTTAMQAAMVGARGLGSGLLALAGGPVGAAVLAIGGLTYALIKLTAQERDYGDATREASVATTGLEKATDAYRKAAELAAVATGKEAQQSREAAAAARDQALAARQAAAALLVKARATIADINAQAARQSQIERFNIRGDRPGSVQTVGRDVEYRTAMANAKSLEGQIANTNSEIAELDKLLSRTVGGGGGGGGGGDGGGKGAASVAVDNAAEEAKRAAEELARSLADIQYSLLSDAEKAAKELAEQTAILNQAVEKGLITGRESQVMQGGLAAQGLEGYEAADIKPIGQEIMRPFQDFADELAREQEQVAGNMARTFTDILASGNIGEAIGNEFKRAAFNGLEIIMKELLLAALPAESGRGFLSQIFGFGGNRANGGGVRAGSSYTVGENGRETFVPSQNGYIIPNMKNMKVGGGQPSVVKLIVDEGSMFSARVQQISGPIAVQASVGAASYSQESMRTQRRRQSQSFV